MLTPEAFLVTVNGLNQRLLETLSPVYAYGVLFIFLSCLVAFVSPLGRVRIGGDSAKPMLSPYNWCVVSLCTTTAIGILFWAMAEPITHTASPPASLGLVPGSAEAMRFALSTVYMHWSFLPCAVYAVPALAFALAFHNLRLPFSLSSPLSVLIGRTAAQRLSPLVDGICLYALVAGMAGSLGTGVLTLAGGLQHLYGVPSGPSIWLPIGGAIVVAYLVTALSGVTRGMTWLSRLNSAFFLFLAVYVTTLGPFREAAVHSANALGEFATHFFTRATFSEFSPTDPWPKTWTLFYWAIWLAWAPITAAFLGRIGVGYTVRSFILVNLFLPSIFSVVWMSIFGGVALALQQNGLDLIGTLQSGGPERLVYSVLATLPWAGVVIPAFLLTAFLSYVTSANSNMVAMAGMSSEGISPESPEPPSWLKLVWGITVGAISMCLLCLSGLDGVRALSYLGGAPALFYVLAVSFSLLKLCWRPEKFGLKIPEWKKRSEKSVSPAGLPQGSLP